MNREMMNDELLLRYSRQIMLPGFDVSAQEKLRNSRVLIIGLGGLGCPAALYLAAAGCGTLVLADFDEVEISNLQRQIAHCGSDIGKNKALSAQESIAEINPDTATEVLCGRLESERLAQAVSKVDLVVDATDNFSTRDAVNKACVSERVPLVSGAAIRMEGQVSVFDPRREDSPCYHCLYEDLADEQLTCSESGVLAPLVGIIGSMQALEAIKCLTGFGAPIAGKLLLFDAMPGSWREFKLRKDPECSVCSKGEE